jgi:hypothetical protein
MPNNEARKSELLSLPVFLGSNRHRGVFVPFAIGPTGATSIGVTSTAIINTMLYNELRKLFVPEKNIVITAQIEKALNWLLHQNVLIPLPDSLRNYLLRHLDMLHHLPLICKIVLDRLASSSQLSLEVYHDPEIQDEYLTLYVRRSHYDESIRKFLDEVTSECQEYLSDMSRWLLLTTDFRPPQ